MQTQASVGLILIMIIAALHGGWARHPWVTLGPRFSLDVHPNGLPLGVAWRANTPHSIRIGLQSPRNPNHGGCVLGTFQFLVRHAEVYDV